MLHRTHNVIEHDGSLSRRDIFFDPSNKFDEETFSNLLSYLEPAETFDIPALANARARHALDMSLDNPTFNISEGAVPVIMGENAMMLVIWGHPLRPVANLDFFKYFFRKSHSMIPLFDLGTPVRKHIERKRAPSGRDWMGSEGRRDHE